MLHPRRLLPGLAGLGVILFVLFGPHPVGEAADAPGGPAFGSPEDVQEMPRQWREKTITYAPETGSPDLLVVLNQQFYEFMVPYIEEYAAKNHLDVRIQRGTCGLSAGMLARKQGDIGAFCCPPGKTDRLPGLRFHTVGIHPVAFLVHPGNPMENVSLDRLRDIFQGRVTRWSAFGWKDIPIQPVIRLHCKRRPGHWRLLLDHEDQFGPLVREVGAIEDVFSLVSTVPGAIGYEVMWLSDRQAGRVKTLKIDGHGPDEQDHVLTGAYPVYRALYITTWEADHLEKPAAGKLVEYVIDRVERYGDQQGIIPVSRLKQAGWKFRADELIGEPD